MLFEIHVRESFTQIINEKSNCMLLITRFFLLYFVLVQYNIKSTHKFVLKFWFEVSNQSFVLNGRETQ